MMHDVHHWLTGDGNAPKLGIKRAEGPLKYVGNQGWMASLHPLEKYFLKDAIFKTYFILL